MYNIRSNLQFKKYSNMYQERSSYRYIQLRSWADYCYYRCVPVPNYNIRARRMITICRRRGVMISSASVYLVRVRIFG